MNLLKCFIKKSEIERVYKKHEKLSFTEPISSFFYCDNVYLVSLKRLIPSAKDVVVNKQKIEFELFEEKLDKEELQNRTIYLSKENDFIVTQKTKDDDFEVLFQC